MINDLDIVQWDYLLSPEFEMINSAGKPLTGGYIEVYIHGTRNKYYCASDFTGTLHPFQIPLDSIGSNVILASPENAYDVYVYNKYGSLIMSRYNVHCQGGNGGPSTYVGDKLFYGQYSASNVTTIANLSRNRGNIELTSDGYLKLTKDMSYHITVRGAFVVDNVANVETSLNYIEYTSVNPIKIDIDETKEGPQYFELSYDIYRLPEDMDYQVAFAQSNGMVTELIVEVHSLSNLATSAAGGDQEYDAGWGIDITDNVISVDPSIIPESQVQSDWTEDDTDDPAYIKHKPEEYDLVAGNNISIDVQGSAVVISSTTSSEFATEAEVYDATVTAIEAVSAMIPDAQVQSDWTEYDPDNPAYIKNKPNIPEDKVYIFWDFEFNRTAIRAAIDAHKVIMDWDRTSNEHRFFTKYEEVTIDGNLCEIYHFAHVETDYTTPFATTWRLGDMAYIYDTVRQVQWAEHDVKMFDHEVPSPTSSDAGKVLTASWNSDQASGIWTWEPVTGFATETEVYDATVTAIGTVTAMIPDVSDMATQTWVNNQGFLTSVPDTYATDVEVSEAIASSVTGFLTEPEVTALIPDSEDVQFEDLDITQFAQASAIPSIQLNGDDQVTAIDGHTLAGGGGGTTYTAGQYISIDQTDTISVTGLDNSNIFWCTYGSTTYQDTLNAYNAGKQIFMKDGAVVAACSSKGGNPDEFRFDGIREMWRSGGPTFNYYSLSSRDGWYRQTGYTLQADWNESSNYFASYIRNKPSIPTIELNGDSQVTAIDGHTLADEGTTYTAGDYISIVNDVISVTGVQVVTALIPDVQSVGNMLSVTNNTLDVTTTAGITDIQLVSALPVSPISSVLYLIPES